MAFDLSQESSQTVHGPVPSGSEVMLELELLEPGQAIPEHKYVRVAQTGLLQLYCKFTVIYGMYSGYSFRQNINLPAHMQRIQLTQGQTKSCHIGGAQLKAMVEASRKPTKMRDVLDMNGCQFPARVRINKNPSEYQGKTYWNNELDRILTPKDAHFDEIIRGGEFITDGPVTGDMPSNAGASQGHDYGFGGGSATADPFGGPDYPAERTDRDQVPF